MQPSYDADDFMRRGFLGSLMGFRKRSSSKTEPHTPPPAPRYAPCTSQVPQLTAPCHVEPHHHHQHQVPQQVSHNLPTHLSVPQNRTEYEIYREIVSEAEYIERSPLTTPDFSGPTTPQPSYNQYQAPILPPIPQQLPPPPHPPLESHYDPNYLMPNQQDAMNHQYHMVMSPLAPHPILVDPNGVPIGTECPMAPPPYSSFAPQSSSPMQQQLGPIPQMANLPFDVKREIQEQLVMANGKQQMSIEEIVKLVVVALKDSQIEEESREEESPEEILRRKRVQNNLAAARYRKRQREARECAEQELGDLTKRNDELREQVERMEREISNLKQAVLAPRLQ